MEREWEVEREGKVEREGGGKGEIDYLDSIFMTTLITAGARRLSAHNYTNYMERVHTTNIFIDVHNYSWRAC